MTAFVKGFGWIRARSRKKQADYLLYRLIDIIVDNYYNVLDRIGDLIEETEDNVYENPTTRTFHDIQSLKKELIYLRKALYPLREALSKIVKENQKLSWKKIYVTSQTFTITWPILLIHLTRTRI